MTTPNFTLAPQLRGWRERAPFVPSLRPTPAPALRARHAPTWAPWWRPSVALKPGHDALAEDFDAPGEVSWDLARRGPADSRPCSPAGRCAMGNYPARPLAGALGSPRKIRREDAARSRLAKPSALVKAGLNGAIYGGPPTGGPPPVHRSPGRKRPGLFLESPQSSQASTRPVTLAMVSAAS